MLHKTVNFTDQEEIYKSCTMRLQSMWNTPQNKPLFPTMANLHHIPNAVSCLPE